MNIFFDMDYTLLAINGRLRPGSKEALQRLKEDGHTLFIWSGMGVRWPEVRELGLDTYVAGVFEKPLHDYWRQVQGMLERRELPVCPDLVVDDYPEIVSALGGIVVRPYWLGDPTDREMERVYRIVQEYVAQGSSADPAFRSRADGSHP